MDTCKSRKIDRSGLDAREDVYLIKVSGLTELLREQWGLPNKNQIKAGYVACRCCLIAWKAERKLVSNI